MGNQDETPESWADRVMRRAVAEGRPPPVVGGFVRRASDDGGWLEWYQRPGSEMLQPEPARGLYEEGLRRLALELAPLAPCFDHLTLRQRLGLNKASEAVLRRTILAEVLRRGPLELVTVDYLLADIVRRVAGMTELALAIYLGRVGKIPELAEIRKELDEWPEDLAT